MHPLGQDSSSDSTADGTFSARVTHLLARPRVAALSFAIHAVISSVDIATLTSSTYDHPIPTHAAGISITPSLRITPTTSVKLRCILTGAIPRISTMALLLPSSILAATEDLSLANIQDSTPTHIQDSTLVHIRDRTLAHIKDRILS
jgi:hypothetical protein